jgi:hypothetical protein
VTGRVSTATTTTITDNDASFLTHPVSVGDVVEVNYTGSSVLTSTVTSIVSPTQFDFAPALSAAPAAGTPYEIVHGTHTYGDTVHMAVHVRGVASHSAIQSVTADLSAMYVGAPNAWTLYDDGTHNDTHASDFTYERDFVLPPLDALGHQWIGVGGPYFPISFTALVAGELPIHASIDLNLYQSSATPPLPTVSIANFTPTNVTPGAPVLVNGSGFTFAQDVVLIRNDSTSYAPNGWNSTAIYNFSSTSAVVPVSWSFGAEKDAQIVFMAPPNPKTYNYVYLVEVDTTSSSAVSPINLTDLGTSFVQFAPPNPNNITIIENPPTQNICVNCNTIYTNSTGGGGGGGFTVYNNTTIYNSSLQGVPGLNGTQGASGINGTIGGCTALLCPPPTISSISPTTASPGQTVVLSGAFSNVVGVTLGEFGTTTIVNTLWSMNAQGTLITFTVPNIAGPIDTPWVASVITSYPAIDCAPNPGPCGSFATANPSLTVTYPTPAVSSVSPGAGGAYSLVTVTGSTFTGATSVTLGGIAVPWNFVSDSTITFVTHPGLTPNGASVTYAVNVSNGVRWGVGGSFIALPTGGGGGGGGSGGNTTSFYTNGTCVIANCTFSFGNFTNQNLTQIFDFLNITNGTLGPNASGVIPTVTNMTPTTGGPGTTVYLTGLNLTNISSVVLAIPNTTTAFGTIWFADPNAPAGSQIDFLAPNSPQGNYTVVVFTSNGTFARAPGTFYLTLPQPTITSITPWSARPYTQVTILGSNFQGVTSVNLSNGTWGTVAVPWTSQDSAHIVFTTLPGIVVGLYNVTVSNGAKTATATYGIFINSSLSPTNVGLSPSEANVSDLVTVTGQNLNVVARITLTDSINNTTFAPTFWQTGPNLTLIVPIQAAPTTLLDVNYSVNLIDSSGNGLDPSLQPVLWVNHIPPPSITDFCVTASAGCSKKGVPFTQVTINGTNFINVLSVSFADPATAGINDGQHDGTAVYWALVSPTQITAITHSGLTPGNYSIVIKTGTGRTNSTANWTALAPKLSPIYPPGVFHYFGVNATVIPQGQPGCTGGSTDCVNLTAKFQLLDSTAGIHINTNSNNKVQASITYVPPGNSNAAPITFAPAGWMTCEAVGSGNGNNGQNNIYFSPNGVFVYSTGPVPINQFSTSQVAFEFTITLPFMVGPNATNGETVDYVTISTTDITSYYIIPPNSNQSTPATVLDHGSPTSFTTCTP